MRTLFLVILVFTFFIFGALESAVLANPGKKSKSNSKNLPAKTSNDTKAAPKTNFNTLPVLFEENKGQFDDNVKFVSRLKNFNVALEKDQIVYQIAEPGCASKRRSPESRPAVPCKANLLKMKLFDANSNSEIRGQNESITKTSYAVGSDKEKWINNIANYRLVQYQDVYQGINVVFRGVNQNLEYDFHVAPQADAGQIQLKFDGAKDFRIDAAGDLIFKFKGIELKHQKPFAYQIVNGEKREVSISYVRRDKNRVGFLIGEYDHSLELVIDPLVSASYLTMPPGPIEYASYLGTTTGGDVVHDIAVDSDGNMYTASETPTPVGGGDIYSQITISKFYPDGEDAVWIKVLGGSRDDVPYGLDIDSSDRVYVTGATYSPNFPLVFAEQTSHPINQLNYDFTAFVFQLSSNGEISYSTYLGGSTPAQYGTNIVADSNSNAYVTGFTCSSNFPTKNAFRSTVQGSCNIFLTKYDFFGHISYSTYFGSNNSIGSDVFTDAEGIVYVVGSASNGVFTTPGAYSTTGGGFVAKFDTNQTGSNSLIYSTRVSKTAQAITVDQNGNAWVALSLSSLQSGQSAQIIKLNNLGSALLVGPLSYGSEIHDIAVDGNGSAYFATNFFNQDFSTDTKVVGLRPSGEEIDSYTIVTTGDERTFGVALGPEPAIVYIAGRTTSLNFPTTGTAYQPASYAPDQFSGQGFFAKIRLVPELDEPLIFIPGIAGSRLYEADLNGNLGENLWTDGLFAPWSEKLKKLSLNPNDPPYPDNPSNPFANVIAGDILDKIDVPVLGERIYYRDVIQYLSTNGYDIQSTGCSPPSSQPSPNMFIFTYDWRLSNIEAANKLSAMIGCVANHYPGKKVNIVTHSMGGLVARRYILDHQNNHNVNKLITTVAPWLGTPKAIDGVFTGRFLDYGAYPEKILNIAQFGAGPQELLPSAAYFTNGGNPLAYRGYLGDFEEYSYPEAYDFVNNQIPSQPYINGADFHQRSGQDNWSNDTSGIKYYHIYGVKNCPDTIGQVKVQPRVRKPTALNRYPAKFAITSEVTDGDGTVARLSAERTAQMQAPTMVKNKALKPPASAGCSNDDKYEHNGIMQNSEMFYEILDALRDEPAQLAFVQNEEASKESTPGENNLTDGPAMNYLDITGVDRLQITDEQGNTNTPLGSSDTPVPGIDYKHGSLSGSVFEFPHAVKLLSGKIADIKFQTTTDDITIQNLKGYGRNNALETIKYLDLQLPVGVTAWLKFTANGVENLRYDADGDGTFETEVPPTVILSGTSANDRTAPVINISYSTNGSSATVTIDAADSGTGVKEIRYAAFEENVDHVYTAPFSVNVTQTKLLFVVAEDNAGNRSMLAKWLDPFAPTTSLSQTPPANLAGWNTGDFTLELKAIDDVGGSGVERLTYSASGAQSISEQSVVKPGAPLAFPQASTTADFLSKTFSFYKEGVTTLTFFAKDKAGNIQATQTHSVKIDKSNPISQHTSVNNGQNTSFTLTATDAVSGVSGIVYSIDGGAAQNYTGAFSVSNSGGHYVTYFARDLAGNEEIPHTVYINASETPKSVLISEFRTRGYLGADDEFIELYNNGEEPVDISSWVVNVKQGSATTPTVLATINNGVVLPARGHYLLRKAGTANYSLAAYAEADQTYTGAMADNIGIALVSNASIIIDAVGFSGVTDTTYREGTALAPSAGISANGQYSFVRNYTNGNFLTDTNSNRSDFIFVSTDGGTFNNLKAVLGSPGPENLNSPIYKGGKVLVSQIDDNVTLAEAPNRLYDYTATSSAYPVGQLSIRRKLTNNSGQVITALKLRITALTTKNSAVLFPQQALLRLINSSDVNVTSADGQTTIPLKGLTVEAVPTTIDGGFNSSLTLNLDANGLAPGQSFNIDLKSGIVTNGQYKLEFRVEAVTTAP